MDEGGCGWLCAPNPTQPTSSPCTATLRSPSLSVCAQDLAVERKWSTGLGELKIKQRVPAGHYELIPSPELQVRPKGLRACNACSALRW